MQNKQKILPSSLQPHRFTSFLTFGLLLIFSVPSFPQWSNDPNVNLQVSTWGSKPDACTDGNGGAFVSWNNFSYYYSRVYLQHVNKFGYIQWNEPIEAGGIGVGQGGSKLLNTPEGDAIIGFLSFSVYDTAGPHLRYSGMPYLQRIDTNGNKLWGDEGIAVSLDTTKYFIYTDIILAEDSNGGVIVLWKFLNTVGEQKGHLYLQRLSPNGDRLWGDNGILVVTNLNIWKELMVSDGEGGVIINYSTRNDTIIQRINPEGGTLWKKNTSEQFTIMKRSNNGGAVMGFVKDDGSFLGESVVANKINNMGDYLWGGEGITLDDSIGSYNSWLNIDIADNQDIVFVWNKSVDTISQLYTQRLLEDGTPRWANPVKISNAPGSRWASRLIKSDSNSIIYVWHDYRISNDNNLFAQKLDSTGQQLWSTDDIPVTYQKPSRIKILSDGQDGAIIAWSDDEPFNGIFIQQISKNGILGDVITSINETYTDNTIDNYLYHNYPNPFNSMTKIKFRIQSKQYVTLAVYDVLGKKVSTLINEEKSAGSYVIEFDASGLSSGIYFYRIRTKEITVTKKMVILR